MNKHSSLIKKVSQILFMLLAIFPVLVLADVPPAPLPARNLGQIFTNITSFILSPLIGLFLTAAVVVFFWGMVKYIYSLGEKEKVEGRWLMVWGVIALFVMVSVWGLVGVLTNTFGLNNTPVDSIVIP